MHSLKLDSAIIALLQLIDDPDQEVYEMVSQKILGYGAPIIPHLEQLWEFSDSELAQERIENLIHQTYYYNLQTELITWSHSEKPSIFEAALIIAKYQYPSMDKEAILHQFELMRRNIWLELNNFLSPLEQINIVNSILFNFFKLHGHELTVHNPNHYYINEAIDTRHGNAFTIGIIYLSLCEMLDLPIFAVDIPNQFVMAYYQHAFNFNDTHNKNAIQQLYYFIDPTNGMVYNKNDIQMYLKKNGKDDIPDQLQPISPHRFIAMMLESLANTYSNQGAFEKANEIENLIPLINKND